MSKTSKDQLDYFNNYRKTKRRRIELLVEWEEYRLFNDAAAAHHMTTSRFITEAAAAYLRRTYITPDPGRIADLELALRRIGNNVNQLAKQAWIEGLDERAMEAAYNLVHALAREIESTLRHPPDLLSLVRQQARQRPEFLAELHHLITDLEDS